jgi:ABC-type amino acid transport substrate-binding protein
MRSTGSAGPRGHQVAAFAIAFFAATVSPFMAAAEAAPGTLDRVKQAGKITFGYRTDARPFAFRDEAGNASGYSIALCDKVAQQVKTELGLATLKVEWVPVTVENRFGALQQGSVDLLCGDDTATLARRRDAAFSITIFAGGVGAILRSDSSIALRQILTKGKAAYRPLWRASPAQILEQQTFSAIPGTTSDQWVASRIDKLHISAKVVPVNSYGDGIRRVLERSSNVFFGERAVLLDAARHSPSARDLIVLDRRFTIEPLALALRRGDEEFRLAVDRALSRQFAAEDFGDLYTKWFGKPDEEALLIFQLSTLPE